MRSVVAFGINERRSFQTHERFKLFAVRTLGDTTTLYQGPRFVIALPATDEWELVYHRVLTERGLTG